MDIKNINIAETFTAVVEEAKRVQALRIKYLKEAQINIMVSVNGAPKLVNAFETLEEGSYYDILNRLTDKGRRYAYSIEEETFVIVYVSPNAIIEEPLQVVRVPLELFWKTDEEIENAVYDAVLTYAGITVSKKLEGE